MHNTPNLFFRYVVVQFSGKYNMITDAEKVMGIIDCDSKMYFSMVECYDELREKYSTEYHYAVMLGTGLKQNEEE